MIVLELTVLKDVHVNVILLWAKKMRITQKNWIYDLRKMYVLINIFCRNCNKDSRIHVKQEETKQMIEENHSCPNCNVKGKLSTVRQ